MQFHNTRKEFNTPLLKQTELNADPLKELRYWLQDAESSGVDEFNAMVLATASAEGHPSSRTVLLKEVDAKGLIFYTNYESRKGQQISANPYASITFYWKELQRQICIEGRVEKVDAATSDQYFTNRNHNSQLSAWASQQSAPLPTRHELKQRYDDYAKRYHNITIPRPHHWGGYRLTPIMYRFWQGQPHRLHDLFCYQKQNDHSWILTRLYP